MTVCKVVDVDVDVDFESAEPCRWIIEKIDLSEFDRLTGEEENMIAKVKHAQAEAKRDELRKTLLAHGLDAIKGLSITALAAPGSSAAGYESVAECPERIGRPATAVKF